MCFQVTGDAFGQPRPSNADVQPHISCRTVVLRKDRFDEREEDFYEALYTQSQATFGAYVETGTVRESLQ